MEIKKNLMKKERMGFRYQFIRTREIFELMDVVSKGGELIEINDMRRETTTRVSNALA